MLEFNTRNLTVSGTVVALHLAALGMLLLWLKPPKLEVIVPASVIVAESIAPSSPVVSQPKPVIPKPTVQPKPAPMPTHIPTPEPTPLPVHPTVATTSQTPVAAASPTPQPAAVSVSPSTTPSLAQAQVELPSTNADYLNNPKPPYSRLSQRLGEHGRVLLRVFVGTDGKPQQVLLEKSCGYERLDESALDTVRSSWRFVPGKRDGLPTAMWVNIPIHFEE